MTFETDRVPTRAAITLLEPASLPPSGTPDKLGANNGEALGSEPVLNVSALAAPAIPGRINGAAAGWILDDVSTTKGTASSSARKAPILYDWISFITSSGTSDSGTPCDSHSNLLKAGPRILQLWNEWSD